MVSQAAKQGRKQVKKVAILRILKAVQTYKEGGPSKEKNKNMQKTTYNFGHKTQTKQAHDTW